jgi:hypothetical protein
MAIVALLTGAYHLGRRRAVDLLADVVGVRISLGALSSVEARVSKAVQPAVDEAWKKERDGPSAQFGRRLLDYTGLIFDYWHEYKAGKLRHETFVAWMIPVRRRFETVLAQAVSAEIAGVSGSCADILEHQAALWT